MTVEDFRNLIDRQNFHIIGKPQFTYMFCRTEYHPHPVTPCVTGVIKTPAHNPDDVHIEGHFTYEMGKTFVTLRRYCIGEELTGFISLDKIILT